MPKFERKFLSEMNPIESMEFLSTTFVSAPARQRVSTKCRHRNSERLALNWAITTRSGSNPTDRRYTFCEWRKVSTRQTSS